MGRESPAMHSSHCVDCSLSLNRHSQPILESNPSWSQNGYRRTVTNLVCVTRWIYDTWKSHVQATISYSSGVYNIYAFSVFVACTTSRRRWFVQFVLHSIRIYFFEVWCVFGTICNALLVSTAAWICMWVQMLFNVMCSSGACMGYNVKFRLISNAWPKPCIASQS